MLCEADEDAPARFSSRFGRSEVLEGVRLGWPVSQAQLELTLKIRLTKPMAIMEVISCFRESFSLLI